MGGSANEHYSMAYWRNVATRAWSETTLLQPWRLYSGVSSAIAIPFVQRALARAEFGTVTLLSTAIIAALAGLSVYAVLTFGEFVVRFAGMPSQLDREQSKEIEKWKRAIPPPIKVEFEIMHFTTLIHPQSQNHRMSLSLILKTREPATLSKWRVRSLSDTTLSATPNAIYGNTPSRGSHMVQLGANDQLLVRLEIDFRGKSLVELTDPKIAWQLEFEDANKPYAIEFPASCYTGAIEN
jgi:hypothetical protein